MPSRIASLRDRDGQLPKGYPHAGACHTPKRQRMTSRRRSPALPCRLFRPTTGAASSSQRFDELMELHTSLVGRGQFRCESRQLGCDFT